MQYQIVDRDDEWDATSRGACAERGRSTLRGAGRAEEGDVEVRNVEEINFRFFDEGGKIQLFSERIEWNIEY